jgi:hypothetical protein
MCSCTSSHVLNLQQVSLFQVVYRHLLRGNGSAPNWNFINYFKGMTWALKCSGM